MVAESSNSNISITLRVWRQAGPGKPGKFVDYQVKDINVNMSFLEMLDVLNEQLTLQGQEPIAFAHDCREGICGTCSLVIDGKPHGPHKGVASCQTYMRSFADGATITVEPFRAHPFPVIKDLITDRAALDQIQQAGGFISIRTGAAPDANSIPVPKDNADLAMDAASCIGCGACVAACKNASAMLFVSAKVGQFSLLPQGQPERDRRVLAMVAKMDELGFGNCTNQYECSAACPKGISQDFIARMNRDYLAASFREAFSAKSESTAGGA
ncbi:MAG TPA: succinate dehydrogenase/fumarate reductase iron-sulfur subunit [Opitutaceae bacterium]|jgi:succinate dehydrogenase / fumarate reductase iron-sulfur subunit|nr:succinate dehydrogenase/fumarate reductase iron-sulfur subunit [Opitutaceae bacterium]HOY54286.1 succinate dehydrogenase/fumarate reductase iron-sulfur subunit [Opitutaceae bacterium]HPG17112.1 succinate dehydrogenase/fumarate reductase iron-sulfur subunit [Opitutaceae bacterium]HPN99203.1 succinate dehydrogenase/fumarate reductase iron-sulfur subunit [Opitutaceae bacterium]HQL21823.1 succinate dehydrogenase/fumarate reductase iron-sulfur subunit [Opitutaceae bacterium]